MYSVKLEDKLIEHFTNNYIKFKKVREELIDKLNKLDTITKNKVLLEIMEYYYCSEKLSESKSEKKTDNNWIKLIKEFIKNMYYTYGKVFNGWVII